MSLRVCAIGIACSLLFGGPRLCFAQSAPGRHRPPVRSRRRRSPHSASRRIVLCFRVMLLSIRSLARARIASQ